MENEIKKIEEGTELKRVEEFIKKEHSIEIKTLVVAQLPIRNVLVGVASDIIDIVKRQEHNVDEILWNESGIQIILKDGSREIIFQPEYHPATAMFFEREEKRKSAYSDNPGQRIWEGEYVAIEFSKSDLLKFLQSHSMYFDPEMEKSIKNMRLTEKKQETTEMIDIDDTISRSIVEEENTTNIPRKFKAAMPLFGNATLELEFEAKIGKKEDAYGREKGKSVILLRVLNARQAVRSAMEEVLKMFPEDIPKHYGRTWLTNAEKKGVF